MTATSSLLRFRNVPQFESNWCIGPLPHCTTLLLQQGKPFQVKGHRFAIEVRDGRYRVRDLKADSFFAAIRQFFTAIGRAATRRQLQAIVEPVVAEPVCSIPTGTSLDYACLSRAGITRPDYPAIGFQRGMALSTGGTSAEPQADPIPPRADGTLTVLRRYPAEPQWSLHSFPADRYIDVAPSAPPYEGDSAYRDCIHVAPSAPPYEDSVPSQPGAGRPPAIAEEGRLYPSLEEFGFEDGAECVGNAGWLPGYGPSC